MKVFVKLKEPRYNAHFDYEVSKDKNNYGNGCYMMIRRNGEQFLYLDCRYVIDFEPEKFFIKTLKDYFGKNLVSIEKETKKTLEEILIKEQARRREDGDYGIAECKKSILYELDMNARLNRDFDTNKNPTSLYGLLEKYVERAQYDCFFNTAMVLACWELINDR